MLTYLHMPVDSCVLLTVSILERKSKNAVDQPLKIKTDTQLLISFSVRGLKAINNILYKYHIQVVQKFIKKIQENNVKFYIGSFFSLTENIFGYS